MELAALTKDMEQVRLQCLELEMVVATSPTFLDSSSSFVAIGTTVATGKSLPVSAAAVCTRDGVTPRQFPRMGTRLDHIRLLRLRNTAPFSAAHLASPSSFIVEQQLDGNPTELPVWPTTDNEPVWLKRTHPPLLPSASTTKTNLPLGLNLTTATDDVPRAETYHHVATPVATVDDHNLHHRGGCCVLSSCQPLAVIAEEDRSRATSACSSNGAVATRFNAIRNSPKSSVVDYGCSPYSASKNTQTGGSWYAAGDGTSPHGSNEGDSARRPEVDIDDDGHASHRRESLQSLYNRYIDVMYTNSANLKHTIMVQQRLFEQQINNNNNNISTRSSVDFKKIVPTSATTAATLPTKNLIPDVDRQQPQQLHQQPQMEWVVKLRRDGSRYIARRPVRRRILRDRAQRLEEERCGLTTTDDDAAVSELKVGRYWTREERRRHLEEARQHRRHKENVQRQRMETVREANDGSQSAAVNVVELGHQKMMRHKNRKVFDDFVTLQEILAHGCREVNGRSHNPLLSVTTV